MDENPRESPKKETTEEKKRGEEARQGRTRDRVVSRMLVPRTCVRERPFGPGRRQRQGAHSRLALALRVPVARVRGAHAEGLCMFVSAFLGPPCVLVLH